MARCSATTKKGSQCRLKALEGSSFCAVHISQDPAAPTVREAIEELEDRLSETVKAVLGLAIVAGIVLSVLLRRR